MTEILKQEKNVVFFDLTLPAEEVKAAEDRVYKKNKQYFNIPGFRKGKAPRKIIENMYGKGVFFEDAVNELLPEAYDKAVEELSLDVIDRPEINIDHVVPGEDVLVHVNVQVKPEVSLGEYKGLEIPALSEEVTEEAIDNALDQERHQNARRVHVEDRAAKVGDMVTIDFIGRIDGEAFEGGSAEDQELELGSGTFIPGFEEQIEGKKEGDTFDVEVTFPEQYHPELAGKGATFEVTLKRIEVEELPELDDEFAMDVSECDTLDEYREEIRKRLAEEVKMNVRRAREASVMEALADIVDVEVPAVMVDHVVEDRVRNYEYNMRSQGIELSDYLTMLGSDMDTFKADMREEAEEEVKGRLGLEAVIAKENLKVTDDEIREEALEVAKKNFADEDKAKEMVDIMLQGNMEAMRHDLEARRALDLLLEHAKEVEEKEEEEGSSSEE